MSKSISRRRLLGAGAAMAASPLVKAFDGPTIWLQGHVQPRVISSGNGNTVKNGGTETCVQTAYRMMTEGSDVLDALIAGVNIVELDPADSSVGYGGLPNADGIVQLDSCCMHGPRKWAGGVASLEGVRTPSKVAQLVASSTDHHLLVGKGAQAFAKAMGMTIEDDLNTENSRRVWLEWKRRTDPEHYLDPAKRGGGGLDEEAGRRAALSMIADGMIDPEHYYGTINCNGINAKGEICGVTTTSGLAFKIPGRVGDSPILGAGLYVDGAVGAAGSTGRGEANLYNLCSFLVVEELRRGKHPKDAGLEALRRVAANTEKRLQNTQGNPAFGLNFYVLDAKGRYAGVCMSGRARFAVCDANGPRLEASEPLFA
ncbi:MAG: N(4)-(beta-N-acetylglucosaminyl)-L-asparaginase [Fimbriimonadaceae bacterium]|nr:N(4)-(beta-N-acetylglucosaminyl)-L-asparaginase [Fimbriimonadaceae bacterium]